MNHIYRIVWNTATACYQAVTESAKGQGKSQGKSAVVKGNSQIAHKTTCSALTARALGVALYILSLPGFAGPAGGQVTAGSATINQAGSATTINQTSNKAAIDWAKFSVGSSESVRFNQPGASSITLNRVTGGESSAIMGKVSANGQVFILNPNGVLFGAGAQVNVGGLVASTLRLDNANFMAGNYKFAGDATGSVVNNGSITVAPGGTLALMAPVVQNTGTLSAPGGSVLLAGAQGVTLTLQADGGLLAYTLDSGSVQALVDNGGLIQASGGHVVLSAKGVDALSKAVVNHSGVIEAQTVGSKSGVIELLGDMQGGTVNLSGKLNASAPGGGNGGFIDTSAAHVQIADAAQVTTAAAKGKSGTWLIDPADFTIAASGGDISNTTLSANLRNGNVVLQSSSGLTPGNGDINVNDEVSWSANTTLSLKAVRNVNINAPISALGASAGVELTGGDFILGNGGKINLPGTNTHFSVNGTAYTLIHDINQLQALNNNLSGKYALANDIDASATTLWNAGAGFDSIGKGAIPFIGELEGLRHVITALSINRPSDSLVGLFGAMNGKVRNTGLENAKIIASGGSHAGILAGNVSGYVIESYSTGSVKDLDGFNSAGGLIGSVGVPGFVYESYSSASVEASHAVGGLVGFHFGTMEDSYATGKVSGNT